MSEESDKCTQCGKSAHQHSLIRYYEWNGIERPFCSYGCEFFWRSEQIALAAEEQALAAFRI